MCLHSHCGMKQSTFGHHSGVSRWTFVRVKSNLMMHHLVFTLSPCRDLDFLTSFCNDCLAYEGQSELPDPVSKSGTRNAMP